MTGKPGEDLHRLVELIERAVSEVKGAKVEAPKKLRDKDTGHLREHDVVLTINQGHHRVVIALECRDRSRPVGVPEVEAFRSKCKRTGIDRGIIVSSRGFAHTALKKAESFGIGCLSLKEAETLDWCSMASFGVVKYRLIKAELKAAVWDVKPGIRVFRKQDGQWLHPDFVNGVAFKSIEIIEARARDGINRAKLTIDADILYAEDLLGRRQPVMECHIYIEYEILRSHAPVSFHKYRDEAEDRLLYESVTSKVVDDEAGYEFLIVKEDNGDSKGFIVIKELDGPQK